MTDATKFWEKVRRGGIEECWEWMGHRIQAKTSVMPYGTFRYGDKQWKTHRLAFHLTFGPIPPGLCVCHKCDNPPCCNPSHLWIGTLADNNRDRHSKGRTVLNAGKRRGVRYVRGEQHHSAKLNDELVRFIRLDARSNKVLAEQLNLDRTTILKVRKRLLWNHVA